MSKKYISKLDGLDPERGDTFICEWSGVLGQLVDFPTPEKAGKVIQAFVRWGKGGKQEELPEAWENSVLKNLIEHQRTKTKEYFRTCHNRETKNGMGDTYVGTSIDEHTQVINKTKDQTKEEIETKQISSLVDGEKRGGQEPPVSPIPLVGDIKSLHAELKKLAPDIRSHAELKDTRWGRQYLSRTNAACAIMIGEKLKIKGAEENKVGDLDDSESCVALEYIDNLPENHALRAMAFPDIPDDVDFNNVMDDCKRAMLDAYLAAKKIEADNPVGFIISRIKKTVEVATQYERAKRKEKDGKHKEDTPPEPPEEY